MKYQKESISENCMQKSFHSKKMMVEVKGGKCWEEGMREKSSYCYFDGNGYEEIGKNHEVLQSLTATGNR